MIRIKSGKLSRLMLRKAEPDPQFVTGECFILWDDGAVSKVSGGIHPGQGQMREIEPAYRVVGIDAGFFGDLGSMQFRDHYYAFTNEKGYRAIREYLSYVEGTVIDYLENI